MAEAKKEKEEVKNTNFKKDEIAKEDLHDVDTVADKDGKVIGETQQPAEGNLGGVEDDEVPSLDKAVEKVSKFLGERAHFLEVVIVKEDDGKQYFIHRDQTSAAKSMRKEAAQVLRDAYEKGKPFNYATLADRLRVDPKDIRALIDKDFVIGKQEVAEDTTLITD